ncbi:hypothetical protein GIB67_013566 [Kingdonia uniflora]|uniref:VHS domain-containing protein n=1 Tax=Kingdonia uniflora TaxID=39325 RepID=A0A7J7KUX4_9MAGN|nr:hypothetical protein GIB67_013566 [Kingdonia uniflora]
MKELFNSPNQTDMIVEDVTSETLNELDWAMNLEICDLINIEKINSIELIRGLYLLLVSSLPFLSMVLEVAKENSLFGASFFSQSCSVNYIFYKVSRVIIGLPVEEIVSLVLGLPPLEIYELPTFVSDLEIYKVALNLYLRQFFNLDKADPIVFNTFDKLESKVVKHMRKLWNVLTIGPAIPSIYLDKRMEGDKDYGHNLFEPSEDPYIKWLNTRETGSVVYLSFGTIVVYTNEQMDEVAIALRQSNKYFLWVVREEEMIKLPNSFIEETFDKGLGVTWCSQI